MILFEMKKIILGKTKNVSQKASASVRHLLYKYSKNETI